MLVADYADAFHYSSFSLISLMALDFHAADALIAVLILRYFDIFALAYYYYDFRLRH